MRALIPIGALLLAAMFVVSCENNSDVAGDGVPGNTDFRIEPGTYQLSTNEVAVTLEVFGGQPPFDWAVSDPSLGTISGTNIDSRIVNYRSEDSALTGANTVRVTDSRSWTASAVIIHP